MDGKLVPAVTSDRTTGSEVAFVARVEERRVDRFIFGNVQLVLLELGTEVC